MAAKTQSALNRMKIDDLVAYAMEEHGLVVDTDTQQKDDIIDMILAAQEDEGGTPPEDSQEDESPDLDESEDDKPKQPKTKPTKAKTEADQKSAGEKRRWVKIHNQEGDVGDKPVFIGCSGDEILVAREKWVHMKQKHINVLKAAKETHFRDRQPRNVDRYRFEVRDTKPDDAEMDEG